MASHPLTSSNRRRRVVLYLSTRSAEPALVSTAAPSIGFPITSAEPKLLSGRQSKSTNPRIHPRLSSHQHQLRIRTLLGQSNPANWVFCGDSLQAMSDRTRDWPSFVGHFSHFVRWQIRRFPDMVIDACLPDDAVSDLHEQLEQRVLRFKPNAVFVMCGIHEARAGLGGLQAFEDSLQGMLREILSRGITPVVHTPPCVAVDGNSMADCLVYVEAIRAITAEQDVPLVDHWDFWESKAVDVGGIETWFEPDTCVPGKNGHEKIAELTLQSLGLTTQADARSQAAGVDRRS